MARALALIARARRVVRREGMMMGSISEGVLLD
jgi:hypothetical protein